MAVSKSGEKKLTEKSTFCEKCADKKNQAKRHIHFLQLGAGLAGHLKAHYIEGASTPEEEQHGQSIVSGIVAWVNNIEEGYGDVADPETGFRLPTWKAWVEAHRRVSRA